MAPCRRRPAAGRVMGGVLAGILLAAPVWAGSRGAEWFRQKIAPHAVPTEKLVQPADDTVTVKNVIPARWTAMQIALMEPAQIFSRHRAVYGMRFSLIYGLNALVAGLDLGLYNDCGRLYGLQMGFMNEVGLPFDDIDTRVPRVAGVQIGIVGTSVGRQEREGSVDGLQISGIFNAATVRIFRGLQVSGLYSLIDEGSCRGIQAAGLFCGIGRELRGMQLAGLGNMTDTMRGLQLAGVGCLAGDAAGVQLAGLFNVVQQGRLAGIQAAGLVNVAAYGMSGFQFAALYNGVDGTVQGMQLGLVNEAYGAEVYGMQVGLINIASRVKGVQVGLLNLAQKMSGVQIGLINIIIEGRLPFFPVMNVSMSF